MPRARKKNSKPSGSTPSPAADSAKPAPSPDKERRIYGRAVPAAVYRMLIASVLGDQFDGVADPERDAMAVIASMAPRDPAEEMLIAQLLFAHARAMRLTALAGMQKELEAIRIVNEYADRASNTYRRLMLALAEYRRPPRTGDTFAVVKQANIAGQQVVQNYENSTNKSTNEQGCGRGSGDAGGSTAGPPAVQADAVGADFTSLRGPSVEALDTIHRPTDGRRQGAIADERQEAR